MNMEKKKAEKQKKKAEEKIHWRKIGKEEFRQVTEIVRDQHNMPNKQLHLQKMEFKSDGRTEYRLCYYIRKNTSSIWRFQRFTAFVPKVDFEAILKEAHARGWF
jgi:hypothetical protein